MSLRLIRSIRFRVGAVKFLSGDGDHRPYQGLRVNIRELLKSDNQRTGKPNHGRDDRPGRPIDSFPGWGSKISIGRWGPSSLPGLTAEHS